MDQHFWIAFLTSILAAIVATAGIYVIRRYRDWSLKNVTYFTCFAAGVLITVAFMHILPESFAMHKAAPLYVVIGYFFMYSFNRFVTTYVCDKPLTAGFALGIVPLIGIGFHSTVDGIMYTITFAVSMFTGFLAAPGLVTHEFAEGIVTYFFLARSGFKERTAAILAFIAAALTTPIGMVVSYPFINNISNEFLGILLALSGGSLLYVGATHLLPHAEKEPRKFSIVALIAGIAVAALISYSGEHHVHEHVPQGMDSAHFEE